MSTAYSPSPIEHRHEFCCGFWRVFENAPWEIRCDGCHAIYRSTPEIADAALRENLAGTFLLRLTEAGAKLP